MERMKRVYICGAIAGNPYAKIQFEESFRLLDRNGYIPLSPYHAAECLYSNITEAEKKHVNFLLITMADYVCILPTFRDSKESKDEYTFAIKTDKGIIDAASDYRVILEPKWRKTE